VRRILSGQSEGLDAVEASPRLLRSAFFQARPEAWMRRRARRRTVKAEHRRIQTFGLDAEERRLKALHWFLYPEAVGTLPI
jgi:hypothetical protein